MGERKIYEPEMLRELEEKIKLVGERLSKSYVDKRRGDSEFEVFNKVFLKVFSMKGVMRFGFRGKHSLRFVGPSEILTRMRKVAYQLTLSPALSGVQDVFHVFMLQHRRTFSWTVAIERRLSFKETPIKIVDTKGKILRRTIPYVKV